ncbi:hypothetical protein [Streptomyces sp. NPDC095602]|uniref:hypothetical protein n=1 Tax=Streptomyces sp. NPDC095602 TaxID=3155819 RepID=UPI00332C9FB1
MRTSTPPLPAMQAQAPAESGIVRVPRSIGLTAVQILGARCGAVIDNPSDMALLFFIPAGAAWDTDGAELLDADRLVTLPPPRRVSGPGPYWRVCPGGDRWHTDPGALYAAMEDAREAGR